MERYSRSQSFWKVGLGVGVVLALGPALAVAQQAQTPYATATLYEVREDINCNPGDSTDPMCLPGANGFGVRIADATLTGNIYSATNFSGPVTLDASSILNQRDWTGPVHGKMTLQNGVRATFSGGLNLSLAILANQPLAPISGKWQGTKGTLQAGGDFNGNFLIPFQLPGDPGFFYLELDANGQPTGGVTPLLSNEFSAAGVPLVKLVVTFYNK
jgi:hypothetical protein